MPKKLNKSQNLILFHKIYKNMKGDFFVAKILRVHNFAESLDALKIAEALMDY